MVKMVILIPLNPCYRRFPDVGTPSICYVDWFWSINQGGLVQVLKSGSLCDKLHFCENLRSDFQEWCFWADVSGINSSYTSFWVCLSGCLQGLANGLTNDQICVWSGKWWNLNGDSVQGLKESVFDGLNKLKTLFCVCSKFCLRFRTWFSQNQVFMANDACVKLRILDDFWILVA